MPRHDCSRRLGACTSCTRVSCKYTGARRVFAEEVPGTWYLYQFQDKAHSMLSALYKFTVNECVQVCVFGPHKVSEGYDTIVHWTQRSNKNAGKYKITVVYPRQCSRLRHGLTKVGWSYSLDGCATAYWSMSYSFRGVELYDISTVIQRTFPY